MKVLNGTGAGCDIGIHLNHTTDSWTIRITDATRDGARAFATPGRRRPDRGRTAMKLGLWLTLWAWPALATAWEEEPAIAFILAYNPVVQAQRHATAAYQPPGGLRRVMEHTAFYVRAASGTSTTVSEGGDTTTTSPMTVGIQLNIPLASPKEQREFAQQALAEATRIDEIRGRALTDLAKLRELEAERAAVRERLDFHHAKADWVQDRLKKGYEGDVEKLWETAQKQNAEAASLKRLDLLIDAQRRHVAHHAGAQWQPLFQYLSGQRPHLPEG